MGGPSTGEWGVSPHMEHLFAEGVCFWSFPPHGASVCREYVLSPHREHLFAESMCSPPTGSICLPRVCVFV